MSETTTPTGPAPRPAAVDTGHDALPSLTAVLWLTWFSFREMSRRRRLLSLAAINLLPVLVVLAIRIWFPDEGITAQMQLASLSYEVIIPFLIPITAMAFGVPAVGEQIDDGTIVFTWTRPIRRRAIFLGRLLAAQVVSTVLMSGALMLCFMIMLSEGLGVIDWAFLKLYLMTFLIIAIGAIAYAAVFAAMGTHFRKPVLPAILFAFGWENLVTNIPARIQEYGLRFHLRNLIEQPQSVPDDLPGVLGAILTQALQRDPVPKPQSVAVLLGVTAVATVIGVWLLKHKEISN
jgi:ABC-type transport system involved in multi-copper enzyme maturation permease subunit